MKFQKLNRKRVGKHCRLIQNNFYCIMSDEQKSIYFNQIIIISNCMLTIPDSRKEDILDLYNRVVHSSLNVIDVYYFWNSK